MDAQRLLLLLMVTMGVMVGLLVSHTGSTYGISPFTTLLPVLVFVMVIGWLYRQSKGD